MGLLRIGTHNVNGIRASLKRGFAEFWASQAADVIGVQEVRCRIADLPPGAFGDYAVSWDVGELAGRNGVALLTSTPPERVATLSGKAILAGLGELEQPAEVDRIGGNDLAPFAHEGRYLEADLADVPVRVASLYLPKGAPWPYDPAGKDKYDRKMRFMRGLARRLTRSRREAASLGREFVVVGDFNIAHTQADLKNWRANQKSDGFLPEEREWLGSILGPRSLIDVVRSQHPEASGPYSWWSWRGQAFANDSGWRIDYQLASPALAASVQRAWSAREDSYEARLSDHCPVIADYLI